MKSYYVGLTGDILFGQISEFEVLPKLWCVILLGRARASENTDVLCSTFHH